MTFCDIMLKNKGEVKCMARKKIEPITNLGNDDKLTVLKSRPLFSLWQSELTLAEFKILDTYLGRIDSHNPNKRIVTFEKGELEEKLGVTKISKDNLELRLKHLMGNVIKVADEDEKKGFRLITLFEEAEAEQDDNGQWKVNLECTQKAMKYIFNIDQLGYLRYKLRCITSITSRYTYIMFCYLESHRKMGLSWEVSLEELKLILNCDKEETYKAYKRFNDLILKKVQKEIHQKTECRYSYEAIRKGRSVVAIRFTLDTLPKTDVIDLTPEEIEEKQNLFSEEKYSNDEIAFLASACDYEFSENEMEFFFSFLTEHQAKLPPNDMGIKFARYHYLAAKFKELNVYTERKKVTNRFNYLKKMIENDLKRA